MKRTTRPQPHFRPCLEALEERRVPAIITPVGDTLTIEGNGARDLIIIIDNGDGDLVVRHGRVADGLAGLSTFPDPLNDFATIDVRSRAGHDVVVYFQAGERTRSLDLNVELGDGNDSFLADINGAIPAGRVLDIHAHGGDDGDFLTVDALNDVHLEADLLTGELGVLTVNLEGGGGRGRDTLNMLYRGQLNGLLSFRLTGGRGHDALTAQINVEDGSGGFLIGVLNGERGDDTLVFHINQVDPNDSFSIINATARGGGGNDSWDLTPQVRRRNF